MSSRLTLVAVLVGALLATACAHSEPAPASSSQASEVTASRGPDGVQSVTIEADDRFRFTPATVHATVGDIHITLRTVGQTPHNLTFKTLGKATSTTGTGESSSIDLRVTKPSTYRFVCTIHESLNQSGKLVVTR